MTSFERAKVWWLGRTARERWMLGGLGVVLALVGGWYGAIAPLTAAGQAARAHRQEAAQTLAEVETAARTLRKRKAPAKGLAATVGSSALSAGIVVARRRQGADGRLTVWIDTVEPRTLMQWILLLRQAHGVGVTALVASKAEAGLQVEVTFSGAAG